jgi:hypothetical protein
MEIPCSDLSRNPNHAKSLRTLRFSSILRLKIKPSRMPGPMRHTYTAGCSAKWLFAPHPTAPLTGVVTIAHGTRQAQSAQGQGKKP